MNVIITGMDRSLVKSQIRTDFISLFFKISLDEFVEITLVLHYTDYPFHG